MANLFAQTLLNGLLLGGIYVTFGVGFSLVFGVLDVIDFAVGGYIMLGAYSATVFAPLVGDEGLFTLPIILAAFFVVGYFIQPFLHHVTVGDRPMPVLMSLAFTFGLAVFIRGGVRTAFGVNSREVPTSILQGNVALPVVGVVSYVRAVTALLGVLALLGFLYFLYRTESGVAIRAIAEDRTTARLMGIDINRYQSVAYGTYVAFTAASGVFIGLIYSASPGMGLHYTSFAFFMVVLAGLGYLPGIIVSAALLGVVQTFTAVYLNSEIVLLVLFAFVYGVLLVRPTGILGRGETV